MNPLGIELLTVLGLPPLEFVTLAADLGVFNISTNLGPAPINPAGYPPFDLAADAKLRREMIAIMRDRGVSISVGEGYVVSPDSEIEDLAGRQFDVMLELGVRRINVVSVDPDLGRTLDQYAMLVELATSAGFDEITCEFAPVLTIRDLPMALRAIAHVGSPNFKLVIDTMHFCRTGGTAADLTALDPALIGYIQVSDAPMVPTAADYMQEALCDRLAPGAGEFPLRQILAAAPQDCIVSLEVPQCARALAGTSIREIVEPIVQAMRDMLGELH